MGTDSDDACLPDLLRAQARNHPDATAVIGEAGMLSYGELLGSGLRVAARLRDLGVRADDRVGVFVEPSLDLMVGVWGVLLAGAAYLPLSPEYPEERLRYMIEDARVSVVFCAEELAGRLAALAPPGTRIVTAGRPAPPDAPGAAAPGARTRPADLAYVIYTSGSTGRPKGVMIEHRAIVSQMRWLHATYGLDRSRVVLQKTPMSFDAAQWEILAVAAGSTVVMGTPGIYRDPDRLIEMLIRHEVTTLQCVPTLLQALLDTEQLHRCTALDQIFCGGEALTTQLARQCLDVLPKCELINVYGPTECTINSSAHTVDPEALHDKPATVPIGRPVDGVEYHILDPGGVPVDAEGVVGELHIGGVQLARGYLHRPELTAERFAEHPFAGSRLYRTGDLASWNADGTVQFAGRADNQVKLRGFRVELEEVRAAIEVHDWVRHAAAVVSDDPRTGFPALVAFVELNPAEAALMDQGVHGAHHQSKQSRLQVRAQLANAGFRDDEDLAGRPVVELAGRTPTGEQRRRAFARKTYRFFEAEPVTAAEIRAVLERTPASAPARTPESLSGAELGAILRSFGQFHSAERLLPKYAYASPGSLYATQLHLEITGRTDLRPGFYYYHPRRHRLVLIAGSARREPGIRVHFAGKRRAIEPVYRNNIREVLEIEAGHMAGLFEEILPEHGLTLRAGTYDPDVLGVLGCAADDYYLGSFDVTAYAPPEPDDDTFDIYVQAHPGGVTDLPAGQYLYRGGALEPVSDELVLKKHVIAINQQVYERARFGVTVIAKGAKPWRHYVDLGRRLQRLQLNRLGLGFMSSGYSSKSGNDLRSAQRITSILRACDRPTGPSYFFVGGRVSPAQVAAEGMGEDVVHMRGPAEIIRDDLTAFLPDYMVPNRVVVVDAMPLTANGKVDQKALVALDRAQPRSAAKPFTAPRTATEKRVARIWRKVMRQETVSVNDDFFEIGGNSLLAVRLVNAVNRELGDTQPMQMIFESPTVETIAERLDDRYAGALSRLVPLSGPDSDGDPVFFWPGLGGYPMNLRTPARECRLDRPVYGVQSYGINAGETPYDTVAAMAAADVRTIRHVQPSGPYTLWGYSFGARVAFETAYQLERAGEEVERLFLIAPGSPLLPGIDGPPAPEIEGTFADPEFVTLLFSVFTGGITDPALHECRATATDEASFVAFLRDRFGGLDAELMRRVITVVRRTYRARLSPPDLGGHRLRAPVTVFRATGDDRSFLERDPSATARPPAFADLAADHYGLLKPPAVADLAAALNDRLPS